MNCQRAREKITDSFASAVVVPLEVSAHCERCAQCQAFFERERSLFEVLNAGLERLVNHPVPPSLLPRVSAELEQRPARRGFWTAGWSFAAIAAAAVLVLSISPLWNFSARRDAMPERTPVASVEPPHPAGEAPVSRVTTSGGIRRAVAKTAASRPKESEAAPEVIVLPEERQGFTHFVVGRTNPDMKMIALTRAAPQRDELPVEIAVLEIKDLEVKRLESLNGE